MIENKNTIIFWSVGKKLAWSDFNKIKKDTNLISLAKSYTEIKMFPYLPSDSNSYLYKVFACFHRDKSYTNSLSKYLLMHEQLHFDITELFARKLRMKIKKKVIKSSYIDYSLIYEENNKAYRQYQKRYDEETLHSVNIEKQKQWYTIIASELEKLKEYSIDIN
ncbi:hypothetical protein [Polaribacter vadi]|uniref:hypothetical protein n=1 Tax=Polaribacter vadi TaxID=1774273 RepID=UPI0030EF05C0